MGLQQEKRAYWQGHVRAWRESGQSQVGYCAEHGIASRSLAYWIKSERRRTGALTLVPISLSPLRNDDCLTLRGPGGWQLQLPGGASAEWLADLMRRLP